MFSKFIFVICGLFLSTFSQAQASLSVTASDSQVQIQPLDSTFLYYNFGRQFVGTTRFVRYDVTNTGTVPLQFRSAEISGSFDFDGYHNCTNGLLPRQQCIFEISYRPIFVGYDTGRFSISFSGNNLIVVDLRGEGI
jgi:hypothetical protein